MFEFRKMHGLGNHFVVFDDGQEGSERLQKPGAVRLLCDPRLGIGGDGVAFLSRPERHEKTPVDGRMRIFNSDGSEAEMCGNAIRCLAHLWCLAHPGSERVVLATAGGVKVVTAIDPRDAAAPRYRVAMGVPDFDLVARGELLAPGTAQPLAWEGERIEPQYVSMGNPHAVLFTSAPWPAERIARLGPWLERHDNHPRRINVEFVTLENRHRARMTVWERGCGLTGACGTGACATAAAAFRLGLAESPLDVVMPGGTLTLSRADDGQMLMTGPVCFVCEGRLHPRFVEQLQAAD